MSLKDQLEKVGFKSKKAENERRLKKLKKEVTKTEKHQERRNFCEICEFIQPDVERFKHKNPRVDAEWICSNCADKNEILDDFRITHQSDSAINGRFRRYYGHTKDFSNENTNVQQDNRGKPNHRNQRSAKKPYSNQRSDNRNKTSSGNRKYIIDENGEKNFNC